MRYFVKATGLISYIVLAALCVWPKPVYIPVFGVTISGLTVVFFHLVFIYIHLLVCIKVEGWFDYNDVISILYYILPAEMIGMLYFAQYHVYLAIGIWAVALVGIVFFLIRCFRKISERKNFLYNKRVIKVTARWIVLVVGVLFLVPSVIAIKRQFEPPESEETILNPEIILNENYQIEDVLEANQEMIGLLKEEKWQELSKEEKLNVLDVVAQIEAQYLGVPRVYLKPYDLQPDCDGRYNKRENIVWINWRVLYHSTAEACVKIVCHEMFHAYQFFMVDMMEWDETEERGFYFGDIRNWYENLKDYHVEYEKGYYIQPMEVSAREYSEREERVYMDYVEQLP